MKPLKIGIVYDNTTRSKRKKSAALLSKEDVSRESIVEVANKVQEVLAGDKHETTMLPIEYPLRTFVRQLEASKVDLIFNLCEAVAEASSLEACVAGLFELLGQPYTGSNPLTLALTLSKPRTKALLESQQIRTPKFTVAYSSDFRMRDDLAFPLIVKPANEDASIGISLDSVVDNEQDLRKQVGSVTRKYRQPALVEEYIEGRELNICVVGNGEPCVLPLSEIDFSGMPGDMRRIVTYNGKWQLDSVEYTATVPVCPAKVPEGLAREMSEIAFAAYRMTGCRDYARVDFRLRDDRTPYVLEVNANPDLSPDAGVARSARAHGWEYDKLVRKIVEFALERNGSDLLVPQEAYGN
ncbi:MAG: ATP-grasp domain-containing protein [Planctomycetota bacterium]|nr:ATP-grasp domain-containing protein [Planctomycetota bacterium]